VAVLLLDRVRPGFTLASSSLSPDQEDEVVAQVLRRLWSEPGEGAPTFRPLAHMCSWWARQAEHRWADDLQGLPAEAVRTGLDLLASLPREWSGPQVLLATDLHHFNILSATEDPTTALADWRMIDPKPYVGDPHYDLTQHLLNDRDRLEADPESFARRMAELTGLDGDRAVRWLFARCVQESGVMDGALGTARALWPVVSRM
jgi:streptomycin 6-kinase